MVVAYVRSKQHWNDGDRYGGHDPPVRDCDVRMGGEKEGPAVDVERHQTQAEYRGATGQQDAVMVL